MSLLKILIDTPPAGAIGWTVLHSLWEGAIIAALLAAVLMAFRSPSVRYAAACAAMLFMFGGFALTLVRMMPDVVHNPRAMKAPVFLAWDNPIVTDFSRPDGGLAAVVPWLAPFWIAGVWLFYAGRVAGWMSLCRLRRRGVCCAPEHWQEELARLSARLRVSRPVMLLESCLAEAPMVMGHFRPVILMPVGLLAGFPPEQVEAILLHELAHIRRFDYVVNAFTQFAQGVLFYHPAAWWIASVIRSERENWCDDVVVATRGDAHEYAVALAALEQYRASRPKLAVAVTGGSLVSRIRRLLYPKEPGNAWTPFLASVILMATATVALVTWQAAAQQSTAAAPPQEEQTSKYDRWLNQDVPYIITEQERTAFKGLTTDEERDKFVEQFWARRDPAPGAPENAFKVEHYRRIAYADELFGAIALAGWKTDRGRIYIMYGPPDEIESHPSGGPDHRSPYEMWRYRYIEGMGNDVILDFIDPTLSREYRLTSDPLAPKSAFSQPRPDRIRVGAILESKNLLTTVDPIYPPLARQARIRGVVRFTVTIGKDGRVSNMQLVNGHPLLVAAARDAVSQWVYRPTLLNGEPVEVITEVDINFSLRDQ
jgi:TonB family protein